MALPLTRMVGSNGLIRGNYPLLASFHGVHRSLKAPILSHTRRAGACLCWGVAKR